MASTTSITAASAAEEAMKAPPSKSVAAAAAAAASPTSSPSSTSTSPPYFEVVGRLQSKADFQNLSSATPIFAVVDFGGTQHKACPGDLLFADGWLDGSVDVNDVVRFTRVLAVGSASKTRIGRPVLPGASVTAAVEELVLDAKQLHFVKRRRKASRRLKGHRQPLTALRVLAVEGAGV